MAISSPDVLKNYHDTIVNLGFSGDSIVGDEIVNIIANYPWILDKVLPYNAKNTNIKADDKSSVTIKNNEVPFCYVIERKSAINAGLANIFTMLNQLNENIGKFSDATANSLSSLIGTVDKEAGQNVASTIKTTVSGIREKVSEYVSKLNPVKDNNLNSEILAPYKYLYVTRPTNKKFIFPLLGNDSGFTNIKNNWGNETKLPGLLQLPLSIANNFLDTVSAGVNLFNQISSIARRGNN
jgi:hypothetical protein